MSFYFKSSTSIAYHDEDISSVTANQLSSSVTGNQEPGCLNIYIINRVAGASGVYYSATDGVFISRINVPANTEDVILSTYAHEVGHWLGLSHTHDAGDEAIRRDRTVQIANLTVRSCSVKGDALCDTPADPDLTGRVFSPLLGCQFTNDFGSLTDSFGDSYLNPPAGSNQPAVNNFMSYAPRGCRDRFTSNQVSAMRYCITEDRWSNNQFGWATQRTSFDSFEPDNVPDQSREITIGNTQQHNFHDIFKRRNGATDLFNSIDDDWVRFRVDLSGIYRIKTDYAISGPAANTEIVLYNKGGDFIGSEIARHDNNSSTDLFSTLELNLQAGEYYLKVENKNSRSDEYSADESFRRGDYSLRIDQVSINNPTISCGSGTGLTANYFAGPDLEGEPPYLAPPIVTLVQGIIDIQGANRDTYIQGANLRGYYLSARWEGSVEAPVSGIYTFNIRTDDGTRMWFNGVQRVNDWGYYGATDHIFTVSLTAGQSYPIKVEWRQGDGAYEAKLFWTIPNQTAKIIPSCRLYPVGNTPTDCNFSVSASSNPTTTGCGGTSSLFATCSGSGCSGVSYAWNGNGNNYTDSPVSVTLPNTNGQVSYNLTASKAGCGNSTASTTVTVSGCTGGGGGTTDRTEGGNASDEGASNPGNEGESQAFDNSNFTKWLIFSPTGKITYDFNSEDSYVINQYTVTAANDEPSRDPKNWVLEGSNDGSNWNIVDSRNDQFFNSPRYDTKPYSFNNTTAYKQYRLNVTANHGNGLLQIAEIQMFGPANGGCTPPSPPLISSNTTTAPANLTASGCGGSITWSNGSNENPLNGVGSGTYTATCTVNNCTSGPSNSIAIVGGGGSCPTYPNAPQWFHWDNASSSLWFAHYGSTGLLYAATDANPATPPLSRQQLLNSGVTPTLANCFLDGSKARIAAVQADETDDKVIVSPNPTTGKIKIIFSLQKTENVWLNLYDTQGRYLDLRNYEGKLGLNEIEFDLQNQPTGVYFVNLQSSQRNEIQKVVKVN